MVSEYSVVSVCSAKDLTCVPLQYIKIALAQRRNFSSKESRMFPSLQTRVNFQGSLEQRHYYIRKLGCLCNTSQLLWPKEGIFLQRISNVPFFAD